MAETKPSLMGRKFEYFSLFNAPFRVKLPRESAYDAIWYVTSFSSPYTLEGE